MIVICKMLSILSLKMALFLIYINLIQINIETIYINTTAGCLKWCRNKYLITVGEDENTFMHTVSSSSSWQTPQVQYPTDYRLKTPIFFEHTYIKPRTHNQG